MNFEFDGWTEQLQLARGEQFGIPPKIWYALAHAADAASKYAGIEPIVFEPLEGGAPGGVCTFYSAQFQYRVWIYMNALSGPVVGLSVYALDDGSRPVALIAGKPADQFSSWRTIVLCMLKNEPTLV